MDYGWLISGPGSTWIVHEETAFGLDLYLTRNFKRASVIMHPQEALKHCVEKWPETEGTFKLWTLTAEIVE
jgi:hypothetical protein